MLWETTDGAFRSPEHIDHGPPKHLETTVSEGDTILTVTDLLKNIQPEEKINERCLQALMFNVLFGKCEVWGPHPICSQRAEGPPLLWPALPWPTQLCCCEPPGEEIGIQTGGSLCAQLEMRMAYHLSLQAGAYPGVEQDWDGVSKLLIQCKIFLALLWSPKYL